MHLIKIHTGIKPQTAIAAAALLAALACLPVTGTLSAQPAPAGSDEVVTLDKLNVTAMRETTDFYKTPASTFTLAQADIKAIGGDSAYDIVRFADGVTIDSMGVAGQSYGAMTSKTVMRGSRRGTLILIDGMPANNNGYYNMEDIPVQTIGRVEMVKGAGSTMYGSEAIGGVINIITDNSPVNTAGVTWGGNQYENYSIALRESWSAWGQSGVVGISGLYQELGEVKRMSSSGLGMGPGKKWMGRFDGSIGQWRLSYQYSENEYSFDTYNRTTWDTATITQKARYEDTKHYVRGSGSGKNWQAGFYANIHQRYAQTKRNLTTTPAISADNDYDSRIYGGDFQYSWKPSWAEFMFGASASREEFATDNYMNGTGTDSDRETVAAFARGSKKFLDSWTAAVSLRESYVSSGDLTAFTPQFQLLKTFPHKFSAYANIGRSFSMPTLNQLYGPTGTLSTSNADLEPEKGWNYETGVKWEAGRTLASLALFYMDFNHITYVDHPANPDLLIPESVPFRNAGIELSMTQKLWDCLALEAGASYGKPREKTTAGGAWNEVYGRVQANARVRWQWSRYFASFNVSYLGDRVNGRKHMMPALFKAGVDLGRHVQASVVIDNVFNRIDVTNHTSTTTDYYTMPRWVKVTISATF
jgi:iron complex outermembrane receptor protein